jgi:hypothetical protein
MSRRFPPRWSIFGRPESFAITDAAGQALAYVYFEDEAGRRQAMKRLTLEEARRIAVNIASCRSCSRAKFADPLEEKMPTAYVSFCKPLNWDTCGCSKFEIPTFRAKISCLACQIPCFPRKNSLLRCVGNLAASQ